MPSSHTGSLRTQSSNNGPDQVLGVVGPRSTPLFVAQNGIVVMEAESVPMDWPWVYQEGPVDDYTGSGYLRFDGNTPEGGAPNGTMSVSANEVFSRNGTPLNSCCCYSYHCFSTSLKSQLLENTNWCFVHSKSIRRRVTWESKLCVLHPQPFSSQCGCSTRQ